MADAFVQVPPDSTGKQIATNDIGGKQFQVVNLADDAGNDLIQTDGDAGLNTAIAVGGETAGGIFKVLEVNASGHLNIADGGGSITVDGPLTDDQLRATAVPVSISGANEVTLLDMSQAMPTQDSSALAVRQAPQKYIDVSFSKAVSGGADPSEFTFQRIGTGQTVNQTGGNLVITAGTTINSETVLRHKTPVNGAFTFTQTTTLSQRNTNNNFIMEWVDVIGDALPYNIVSTTLVDVTKTAHGFTADNIGQSIDMIAISSVGFPTAGVIQSIPNADTIRFTVAGWPASGSGTLSLTGWNKVYVIYSGTTVTNMTFVTRRRGYDNALFTATCNSTTAGHLVSVNTSSGISSIGDQLATAAGVMAPRGTYKTNVPEPDVNLYLQIRSRNAAVAPTATTWTIGMVRAEDYIAQQVELTGTRMQSSGASLPTNIIGTVPVSGTVSVASGTMSTYPIVAAAAATGVALLQHKLISAATTNATSMKASAGRIAAGYIANNSASWRYLKLYNKASAPTVGTDVPVQTIGLAPNTVSDLTALTCVYGMSFATGIAYAITANPADADTTAIGASEVIVAVQYI